ncbi:hypothetical protein SLEP1_g41798 [Rubroshorea leprosula]|uniref:Uncharacterized protein n=1 Tax=Rubroshorea leprosula TaxID=152421 RepID=A0AAV5L866_9ROSI|nr:hypothetical protein SLEP1_g41798 [Rubroshorea leprosula]
MVHTRSVRAGNSSLPHGQGQPPNSLPSLIPPQIPPQLPPQVPVMFPPVDHAEGGDENQPHVSAHNSTSTANHDVVTAQLVAMQQQFGVFQLVLAQLLARNNPGDPLINLLHPAQQPPAPQQNPQPAQPAPAVSESQDQSHIAPAQQPIPDDVTRRLDSLEKLVAEHRGAPPPRHATDSIPHPLNTNITLEPYPTGFKIPQLETYDGTKDPDDHLHAFYSCMQAQNASDALMCKIFPSTFRGNARTWYYSLPPRSISSYTEMASAFATKFSSRRLIRKTTSELMRVKQRDGESLKNYMSRFNDAVLEVSSFDQAMGIAAVIAGLKHDRFRDSLIKHAATTFSKVNDRSLKFITAEEYTLAQNPPPSKNQNPEWRDDNPSRKRMRMAQNRGPMLTSLPRFGRPNSTPQQQSAGKPPVNWTPFNLPRSQIFMQIKNKMDLRRPGPMRTAAASRDHTRYCDFHQDHGHTTEQCNSLKSELESLAQKGMLNEYVQRAEQPRFVREQRPQPQGVHNPPNRQAVVSQSHLCMKFPTPMGIATLRGNQEVARHCYITSVTQPTKGKDKTPEVIPQQIPDNQQVMGVEIVDNRPDDETRAAPVEDVEEVLVDDRDPSQKTQIGTRLNPEERAELIAFLRANNDVFAWTSADMPGIPASVCQHKLSTNPLKKPVAQKRRLFRGERLQAVKEEVEKLLQAGFVRKVDYCEWVANPVMVKKANGKWRMCIDYTNLNNACPKDCYPMPSIDKLVEAASGNESLSLLDAYSGYHQVPMAPEDEEKTSFYAGDEIYCYVMMPFGLKNAGATYQKMVTIVFRAQIGKNLEVYVDDIVVKSLKAENHLADLDETFNNLRKNQVRLNPAKCIFGVESGKFLDGEILYLYLEISDEAISLVLVREEAKQQKPIYYISSVLHGAELRYPIAEKAALAVVTSARKLRPYFQSHPIIVLTDQPLRQILQKPECSGRLIKWAVELGEFEITFQQRSTIRAQALADFIVECTPCPSTSTPEPNEWTLYVDGASSSKGSGAGALLIGPEGYRSEHALKFNFDATNNMAEYEALLLGLQLALELKISAIQVYSDSQLVVNQINSICEVVDPVMVKYVALVAELKCKFQKFCLSKIPRAENEQADSLSKFASDSSLSSRSVFVEVLDEPSFMKPRVMEISTDPDTPSWTDLIVSFLRDGIVPENRQEAMKLRKKASRYTLVDEVLYKRSFSLPLLRCLSPYESESALREVHEGVCGSHVGARTLAHKVLRQGYYWPNMYKDATCFVQKCPKCQFFAHLTHQPAEELTNMVAPWPFAQWGLDLLGPFVKGVGGVTHLVVGVDYFTKWVEARPLSSLTSKKVEDFVFSSIICRYGIPNQIVADNGTQFNCASF